MVKSAFYHAVVKTPLLVGAGSVQSLKILACRENIYLPPVERGKMFSHFTVKSFRLLSVKKPYSVRRITHYRTAHASGFYFQRVGAKTLYILVHPRAGNIRLRRLYGVRVDIRTVGAKIAL